MEYVLTFLIVYYFEIALTLTTSLGAAGMYVFSDFKGFENSKSFLRKQFPERKASSTTDQIFYLWLLSEL